MQQLQIPRRSVLAAGVSAGAWAPDVRCGSAPSSADSDRIHGVWLAGPAHNRFWRSRESMWAHMAAFARSGVDTVYVCALSHGRTHFRSSVMRGLLGVDLPDELAAAFVRLDPLAEAIEAGRSHGVRVAAWLEFGFASHHAASERRPTTLDVRPHWAARDIDGQPVVKNGFHWLDALNPEVQQWMVALWLGLAQSHPDLHAIQGDDRLPALPAEGGYSEAALRAFGSGAGAPPTRSDPDWVRWRARELTHWLGWLRDDLRAAHPGMALSLAPSPWPWGRDAYLQDWPAWVTGGLCDELVVQLYRRDAQAYERLLQQSLAQFKAAAAAGSSPRFAAGMLRSLGSQVVVMPQVQSQMLAANERAGVRRHVWFHSAGHAGL